MNNHYAENRSEVLSTLLAGFNELIRNSYLRGFQDGQDFELKLRGEAANQPDIERVSDGISELNPIKVRALKEAELILMVHS